MKEPWPKLRNNHSNLKNNILRTNKTAWKEQDSGNHNKKTHLHLNWNRIKSKYERPIKVERDKRRDKTGGTDRGKQKRGRGTGKEVGEVKQATHMQATHKETTHYKKTSKAVT